MTRTRGDSGAGSVDGAPGFPVVVALLAAALAIVTARRVTHPVILPPHSGPPAAAEAAVDWPDMRIDVNRATVAELTLLPGIGPRLAERIVANREAVGPFRSIDDLTRVKRVGPVLVDRIRSQVIVSG